MPAQAAPPFFPGEQGTTWEYEMRESFAGNAPSALSVRINGIASLGEKQLLKLETLAGDAVRKTELISIDTAGVHCHQRTGPDGKTITFDPPQTLVPAPLTVGARWSIDDHVIGGGAQEFTVTGEEDVAVPAGNFRAFRIHCDQQWPISGTIDRWFVPGTGFVKDVTTSRGPTGRLLGRASIVLKKLSVLPTTPAPAARSTAEPTVEIGSAASGDTAAPASADPPPAATPEVTVEVAAEREGEPQSEFRSNAPQIFVRWAGSNLPSGSRIRIVWIAEDVGDIAPANFIVDETDTIVTVPELNARFTLSRPQDGWAAGKYRVEVYIDDQLMTEVPVTIRD